MPQFSVMQTEVLDRLTVLSTSTYITTAMVKRWLNMGMHWALTWKKWPFLEMKGADLIDATATYPYPTGMRSKSAFLVRVDNKRYEKIRYEDYLTYLEDYSTGTDKVWAEYDRSIYINANACVVGNTVEIYGQESVNDMSADADTTPFTAAEPLGDEAVIDKAVSMACKKIPGLLKQAQLEEQSAMQKLEIVWARIQEAKPREVLKSTPLLRKIDVLKGHTSSADPNNIGQF